MTSSSRRWQSASPRDRAAKASLDGGLRLFLDREHLAAAIAARFQVDVMRPSQLAGVLILDIGGSLKPIVAPPVATLHARGFSFRNSHFFKPFERTRARRAVRGRPYSGNPYAWPGGSSTKPASAPGQDASRARGHDRQASLDRPCDDEHAPARLCRVPQARIGEHRHKQDRLAAGEVGRALMEIIRLAASAPKMPWPNCATLR